MKILYVDKSPRDYFSRESRMIHEERENAISQTLKAKYETSFNYDLHSHDLEEKIKNLKPDLLITHLPFNSSGRYTESMNKLKDLIKNYSLNTIVYTGASEKNVSDENLKEIGVKGIVRKYNNEEDCKNILNCIEEILRD